jgi:quercetin dioxygenase-like cupin family protein
VRSPYSAWLRDEGLVALSGNYQEDLLEVPLQPWPRVGGAAAILNHDRSNDSNDCRIVAIAPGGELAEERHLFEEMVYVLSGRGATRVADGRGNVHAFEWRTGSLFAVPLNAAHQHFNGDGAEPARLLMVTNAPVVLNMFRSLDFVYGCEHMFEDRFDGDPGYFSGEGVLHGREWRTNFIADVRAFGLIDYPERGGGGRNIQLTLAGNSMKAHISEFAVGEYKKAHRHGAGAHVVILDGCGYSLMWRQGAELARYDWRPGSLIVPPDGWFHQHFNTGTEPARYLALRYFDNRVFTADGIPSSNLSTRLGGDQIEYEDEDPKVREMFDSARAAAARGGR